MRAGPARPATRRLRASFGRLRNLPLPALVDLASLFAGRVGGLLVTLVFIPRFDAALGPAVFGAVSVVLSLQAFFLVSDLGLATLISRDTAIARGDPEAMTAAVWTRRRAELLLGGVALGLAAPAVLPPALAAGVIPWSIGAGVEFALIVVLIAALVAVNIAQLSLNALGRYRESAGIAVAGAVARGGATVVVLGEVPTLAAFLGTQAALALVHLAVVRLVLERRSGPVVRRERLLERNALGDMLRRCVPLTIYTLAGAAAVNLDKPIISAFVSLEAAGVYFLATTYALVPVALLSGPLNSYFAPKVAHALHAGDPAAEERLAAIFQIVLMCAVVAPSLGLILEMERWLRPWLGDARDITPIMAVAPVLLAGGALSATGYYASTYLIAAGDNGYLARLSLILGVAVLSSGALFAWQGRVEAIAWSYFAFYAAGLAGLWGRVAMLKGRRATGGFLLRTWLLPAIAVAGGYALGAALTADAYPLALIVPALTGGAAGALVLAAVVQPFRRRAAS